MKIEIKKWDNEDFRTVFSVEDCQIDKVEVDQMTGTVRVLFSEKHTEVR